jgi:hypothetical protein
MGETCENETEAEADRAQQKPLRSTRVELESIGLTENGRRYRVTYAGETLVEGRRNPIFNTCRALVARGITRRLEVWRRRKTTTDMLLDLTHRAACSADRRVAASLAAKVPSYSTGVGLVCTSGSSHLLTLRDWL